MPRMIAKPGALILALTAAMAFAARTADVIAASQQPIAEAWRQDLQTLARELEARHANLYHTVSADSFRSGIDALAARVADLEKHEIVVEMARLVAGIGDGHTLVNVLWDRELGFHRLPLELARASDGVVVLAADPEHADLLGAQVLRIGDTPIEEAANAAAELVSRDNAYTPLQTTNYLIVSEVLHALRLADSIESVKLFVKDTGGRTRSVRVEARAGDAVGELVMFSPADTLPLWLRSREDRYWFSYLPAYRTVYVQFSGADYDKEEESLAAFGERLHSFVKDEQVDRLVVDLRWNDGGSRWRARHLLNSIIRIEAEMGGVRSTRERQPSGKIFTIIGPTTFSAATQFALDLDLHTNTVFVGEPTGGKPNHYGEVGRFRLPNSGVEIRYAVFYHQASHPRDTRPAIFPDVKAAHTVEDYRTGRDPALEAVWGYEGGT